MQLDRRDFLKHGASGLLALSALGAGGALLDACGSSSSTSSPTSSAAGTTAPTTGSTTPSKASFGAFDLQVNWLAGAGWEGDYLAKAAGVYQKQGFSGGVNLLYGGPNVAVEPIIESGKALMGICNSETFAAAVQQGASLVAVGAYFQQNPFCIASMPAKPIRTAQDIIGKKIGIQALNESEWAALLKVNNISPSSVTKVIVQNDPTPLVNGQVDGFLSFVTNQPVTLELKGYKPVILMLDTIGFTLYQQVYAVTTDSLKNRRAEIVAGLRGEIIGKQMFIKDPTAAIQLTVKEFGASTGLTTAYETASVNLSLPLAQSAATKANGLMYMSPSDIAKNVETLKLIGLGIPATSYTDEILDTIYAQGTTLL